MNRLATPLSALAVFITACAAPPADPPPVADTTAETRVSPAATPDPKDELPKKVGMNEQGEVSSISLEDFFLLQQSGKALIFDARPAFFYNQGHIPGAINLPKKDCDARIHKLDGKIRGALAAGKTIVVYCTSRTCADARTVAIHLSHFGHSSSTFGGGWKQWAGSGMPTE